MSQQKSSFIGGQERNHPLRIELREGDAKIKFQLKEDATGGSLEVQTPSFRPIGALKSVAKTVWHVLTADKQRQYDQLRRWIIGELSIFPCLLYQFFIPGPGVQNLGICVWEHQQQIHSLDFPPLVGLLFSGNTVLVFPLPFFDGGGIYKNIVLPALPYSPFPNHYPVGIKCRILGDGKHRRQGQTFELGFLSTPMLVYTKDPTEIFVECTLGEQSYRCQAKLHTPDENKAEGKVKQLTYRILGDDLGGEIVVIEDMETHVTSIECKTEFSKQSLSNVQNFLQLSYFIHKGTELMVKEKGSKFPLMVICPEPNEEVARADYCSLVLAKTIFEINRNCGTDLEYPEAPTAVDFNKLMIFNRGMADGEVEVAVLDAKISMLMPSEGANAFVSLLKSTNPAAQQCVEIPWTFSFCIDEGKNIEVVLNPIWVRLPPGAKIVSCINELNGQSRLVIECTSLRYIFRDSKVLVNKSSR